MLRDRIASKANRFATALNMLFAALSAAVSATLRASASSYVGFPRLQSLVAFLRDTAWISLPSITLATASVNELRARVGTKTTWQTAQLLIDQYREELFSGNTDPIHFHNVTLFQSVKWRLWFCRWPGSGWMRPVIRSGHRSKKGIPWFKASLDNPDNAQGVAGRTFTEGRQISIENLPAVSVPNASEEDVRRYAETTFVTTKWVRSSRERRTARSFLGVPIEVSGKPWGALVVDSQGVTIHIAEETAKTLFMLQRLLGKSLDSGIK